MADINFIILKINDIDIEGLSYKDAVDMFLKASNPILLEVRHPKQDDSSKFIMCNSTANTRSNSKCHSSQSSTALTSILSPAKFASVNNSSTNNRSTETTTTVTAMASPAMASPAVCSTKPMVSTGIQTDTMIAEYIFSGSSIDEQSNEHIFDECLPPEIDIEEVTLRKSTIHEKLGLTVSYSSGSDDTDTCTEVYISDIIPNSVAARDGRLRQGDQILQVNGRDVSNKEDTETLIAENKNAVTFLVSRYLYVDDDIQVVYDESDGKARQQVYQNSNSVKLNNCFPPLDSSTSCSSSSHKSAAITEKLHDKNNSAMSAAIPNPDLLFSLDLLNDLNIEAHLESVNQELALLDTRVENSMMLHNSSGSFKANKSTLSHSTLPVTSTLPNQNTYIYRAPIDSVKTSFAPSNTVENATTTKLNVPNITHANKSTKIPSTNRVKQMESDTEHIYETIPEDAECEPFYCVPYETVESNLVEQWLEMQQQSLNIETLQTKHKRNKSKMTSKHPSIKTVKSNSSGEDHENSSSAYNTGGSGNSNIQLTLEVNSNVDGVVGDKGFQSLNNSQAQQHQQQQQKQQNDLIQNKENSALFNFIQDMNDNCEECQRQKKNEKSSPKHEQKSPQKILAAGQHRFASKSDNFNPFAVVHASTDSSYEKSPEIPADTMYTNMANLKRTMILQQKLFRQALQRQNSAISHSQTMNDSIVTPATERLPFNAPNLSQYHFVSSQEVTTANVKQCPCDEQPMVWKVKRRQDGTRYIVRRPARNRILRERAIRITTERNDQTTEDDTISEIKTGRYWTKEERKKHFERSKERRLRQQLIAFNKFENENDAVAQSQQSRKPTQLIVQHGRLQVYDQPPPPPTAPILLGETIDIVAAATTPVQANRITATATDKCGSVGPLASQPATDCQTLHKKSVKKKKKDDADGGGGGGVSGGGAVCENSNKAVGFLSVTTV